MAKAAKAAKPAASKKASKPKAAPAKAAKPEAAPVKPIKEALTKSALIDLIATENELSRKVAAGVYGTLEKVFLGSVHPRGVGELVLPGLLKVTLRKVPARRAGTLIRNPATGEMMKAAAKPASMRVIVRPLAKLKKAATP